MKSIIVLFEVKSVKREKERGFDLSSMFEPLLRGAEPASKKHSCNLHALLYESFRQNSVAVARYGAQRPQLDKISHIL